MATKKEQEAAAGAEAKAAAGAEAKAAAGAETPEGDLVVSIGKSIYCRKGQLKAGTPVKAKYFTGKDELAQHVKRGTVCEAKAYAKAVAKAKAAPER